MSCIISNTNINRLNTDMVNSTILLLLLI
jgi:hypothetical protein